VELMEKVISEFINPRKLKWTIYASFVQLAVIFILLILLNMRIYTLPFDSNYLLIYGLAMSLLSVKNTRTKYEKLNVALSIQPIYCPHCRSKKVAMLPTEYKCPECHAISKKEI
jgi:rubredoxin